MVFPCKGLKYESNGVLHNFLVSLVALINVSTLQLPPFSFLRSFFNFFVLIALSPPEHYLVGKSKGADAFLSMARGELVADGGMADDA